MEDRVSHPLLPVEEHRRPLRVGGAHAQARRLPQPPNATPTPMVELLTLALLEPTLGARRLADPQRPLRQRGSASPALPEPPRRCRTLWSTPCPTSTFATSRCPPSRSRCGEPSPAAAAVIPAGPDRAAERLPRECRAGSVSTCVPARLLTRHGMAKWFRGRLIAYPWSAVRDPRRPVYRHGC